MPTNRRTRDLQMMDDSCSTLQSWRSMPRSEDGLKAPLLSDRPEKRATQGEIDYSERDSLVEDLCGNSPEIGEISVI